MDDAEIRVHDALETLRDGRVDGDWDDVVRRATRSTSRRRRRRRVRGLAGAFVAAAVAAGGFVLLLPHGTPQATAPAPSGHVQVLERPQTAADRLPAWVLADPGVSQYALKVATSRVGRDIDGDRYVVVRAGRPWPDSLCLVVVPAVAPTPATAPGSASFAWGVNGLVYCTDARIMQTRFLAFAVSSGGAVDVVGVVPDEVTQVTAGGVSTAVVGNVFRLHGVGPPDPVVARGVGGERRAYVGLSGVGEDVIPTGLSPRISVFTRRRTAADGLPPRVAQAVARDRARSGRRTSPWARMPVAATSRYAGEYSRNRYWLMRDERHADRILFAYLTPGGRVSFGQVSMPTRATPVPASSGAGGIDLGGPSTVGFATLIPDGFTSVAVNGRRFPITANFARVSGIRGPEYTAVFTGPAGRLVMRETIGAPMATILPSVP